MTDNQNDQDKEFVTITQLDQGPEIPSSMQLPSGMAAADPKLLTVDDVALAVKEGEEINAKRMAVGKAREK